MPFLLPGLLAGAVILVSVLAALRLWLGFRQYLRYRTPEPFEPMPVVNPPEPVARTIGVELVAWVAIVWSATNLAMLVAAALTLHLQTQLILSSVAVQVAVTVYSLVAAGLIGWGGVMLLRLMAYGRRMVAWGVVLFAIVNVFSFAFCLFLHQYRDTPPSVRWLMIPIAVILAAHTVIGCAIGVAAQHVGLAADGGASKPAGAAR